MHRLSLKRFSLCTVLTLVGLLTPGVSWAGAWGEKWGELVWGQGGIPPGPQPIPTLSTWGVVALLIIISASGMMILARRRSEVRR